MTNDEMLRYARRAADEVRAGRRAKLPPLPAADARRVATAVRRLLAGWEPTESPD